MNKICLFLIVIVYFSPTIILADEYQIIPQHKAKIFRDVGETVYVACKKNGSLKILCYIDCGNGQRFEANNGYCTYQKTGIFRLNISTLNEVVNPFHTATVTILDKIIASKTGKKKKADELRSKTPLRGNLVTNQNTKTTRDSLNQFIESNDQKQLRTSKTENIQFTDIESQTIADIPQLTNLETQSANQTNNNFASEPLSSANPIDPNTTGLESGLSNFLSNNTETLNNVESLNLKNSFDGPASGNNHDYGFQLQQLK